ncbi:uncharacterized protein LOC143433258 [Xylocopa sonorina]|uniref:uncharacterized protein LOC143433258 n=1 Tax=Xylocopa sonorina TaxID=1818115 RepID=UPI00403AF0A2
MRILQLYRKVIYFIISEHVVREMATSQTSTCMLHFMQCHYECSSRKSWRMDRRRILKTSISRKPVKKLSARQKRRIRNEIKNNMVAQNPNIDTDMQNLPSTSAGSSFSYLNSFRDRLASCFIDSNLTHKQGNNILSLLRSHSCFSNLPKDVRTLLNTPRDSGVVSVVPPGEYIHFSLQAEIQKLLQCKSIDDVIELKLDIHTDGCTLDKSNSIHLWPIQCRVSNIPNSKPIIVGIYRVGSQKPYSPITFFDKIMCDIKEIILNGGVSYQGKIFPLSVRCFIADAPARAFILNHRGHTSYRPCSKCKISGIRQKGRYVFTGVHHSLRNDEMYVRCLDEDHHKEGRSPLSLIAFGMVSQVPFEYMHLVCLGVMKKLLSAWIDGKYSHSSKLCGQDIQIISSRLIKLKKYCPSDFTRRPREIEIFSKFKATEFRQFLLYTGPFVTHGLLSNNLYKHFLFLHASMRILISPILSENLLEYAELALQRFVIRSELYYGCLFNSYNIHGLLHLSNDVRHLGNLDSFSAFPYESNMSLFKKYCRKPHLPLQQIFNRKMEEEQHGTRHKQDVNSSFIHVSHPFGNGTHGLRYQKIQFANISLGIGTRDNCCILYDGRICIIKDIYHHNNTATLVAKRFMETTDFYNVGILSSALDIYKCSTLSTETFFIQPQEVRAKCYRMPLQVIENPQESSTDDDEEHCPESGFIVAVILHSEITAAFVAVFIFYRPSWHSERGLYMRRQDFTIGATRCTRRTYLHFTGSIILSHFSHILSQNMYITSCSLLTLELKYFLLFSSTFCNGRTKERTIQHIRQSQRPGTWKE